MYKFYNYKAKNFSRQWINYDCPNLYNEKDEPLLTNHGLNGFSLESGLFADDYILDKDKATRLLSFIEKSLIAFDKECKPKETCVYQEVLDEINNLIK